MSAGNRAHTYAWSPSGGSASSASGLSGRNYTVTVTDGGGCLNVVYVTISEPAGIVLQTSSTGTAWGSTRTTSVIAAGGTVPYTYSWSPGTATTSTASGLTGGNYTVTVTDANTCTSTAAVVVPNYRWRFPLPCLHPQMLVAMVYRMVQQL